MISLLHAHHAELSFWARLRPIQGPRSTEPDQKTPSGVEERDRVPSLFGDDRVEISSLALRKAEEAQDSSRSESSNRQEEEQNVQKNQASFGSKETTQKGLDPEKTPPGDESESDSETAPPGSKQLTDKEKAQVAELQARDREVRAHEQAHKAAAGDLATGGPTYSYEKGPDGRRYAVGGEVGISLREGRTPEETERNARRAAQAALAPASPSSQDLKVAGKARQMAAEAAREAKETPEGSEREIEGQEDQLQGLARSAYEQTSASLRPTRTSDEDPKQLLPQLDQLDQLA